MMARLAAAVLAAVALGYWLARVRRSEGESKTAARLRALVLGLCGFWGVTFLVLAAIRLTYPFELEWCGGAMRDMAARTLRGEPLYGPPGPGWFPYEYPPLYLWASGLLMKLMGGAESFVPMRLISILSTVGCAWMIYWWIARLSGGRTWGLIAAGIFLASYRFTGAWYDVERLDMLFLFLSLAGICLLQCAVDTNSSTYAALAAGALALAFLTKQQAVLFILGGIGALIWLRQWKLLAWFGGLLAVLCAGSVAALNGATGGWFWYYCFRVPMANGIRTNLALTYVVADLPLFAPLIALIVIARQRLRGVAGPPRVMLWAMTAMGVFGSWLSRAHWGGDQNVLMAGYLFLGCAASVFAGRLSAECPSAQVPIYGLVLAQLLVLTYKPGAQVPTATSRAAGERYAALIRELEREGPVLSLEHGGFTSTPRFHLMGILDVMHTEKGLPAALTRALKTRYYAAIVMDARPENTGYLGEIVRNYPRIENIGIGDTWVVTGFPTPSPARSIWVLRP